MKLLLVLSLAVSVLSSENCRDADDFRICTESGRITSASRIPAFKNFELKLHSDTSFAPNVFNDPELRGLDIQLVITLENSRPVSSRLYTLTLEGASFEGLPSLTNLTIRYAHIIYTDNFLTPLVSLKQLRLMFCQFLEVPRELLAGAPNLEELSLQRNRIRVIRENAFATLKSLKDLNLSYNRITTLEPGCFAGLEGLRSLDLSYSDLVGLDGRLQGLSNLRTLRLRRAFVPQELQTLDTKQKIYVDNYTALQPGMFQDVPRLQNLILDRNPVDSILKNVFNHLQELKVLSLWKCSVGRIEPGAFSGLNLDVLDISDNMEHQQDVSERIYNKFNGGLVNQRNHVSKIEPGTFQGLTAELLDMSQSGHGTLELTAGAFEGSRIRKVKLDGNYLLGADKDVLAEKSIV